MKIPLTPEQAAFRVPTKPEVERFNLREDPYEINSLADDPRYAQVKAALLSELANWRKNVIHDQGVSTEFRAKDVFPATCPCPTVGQWVDQNAKTFDFNKVGWPAWYPTRGVEEWEKVRALWEPYVFRQPTGKIPRPTIPYTGKGEK